MPRLSFTLTVICFLAGLITNPSWATADGAGRQAANAEQRPNILFITADDLNYENLNVTGCKLPGLSPNLDRLAAQGMLFTHAHVTVANCQPSRSVLMTGRYPINNGALGFQPIREDVPTLQERLRAGGYFNGILAKNNHLAPDHKFCWDMSVKGDELKAGRLPSLFYTHSKAFFEKARASGKPFFLMANSQDPHRPFPQYDLGDGHDADADPRKSITLIPVSRTYSPKEVEVPGFLPDLPKIRREIAQFYSAVHRCDESVGQILKALKETGYEDNTLVMFIGDNGMPFSFAKTNCYRFSTRTPWMVRWPDKVKPGSVNTTDFISGIDFTPTVLEAAGLPPIEGVDGRSFLPLLHGEKQEGRDRVMTVFERTAGKGAFPMRSVQDRRYGYIFNAWSDGKTEFRSEANGTPSFKAMQAAAKTDPNIAARVQWFLYRGKEEFYDYEADPNALRNLMDDPAQKKRIAEFRVELHKRMKSLNDPVLIEFEKTVLR